MLTPGPSPVYVVLRDAGEGGWWDAWGPTLVPLSVALIALAGVVWSANRNHRATIDAADIRARKDIEAEDRRAKNLAAAEVRSAGRESTLDAVEKVASSVRALKEFNRSMSGNTGEGEEDDQSAQAIAGWFASFESTDPLERESLRARALGSRRTAEAITAVRDRMFVYLMSLEPPVFKGAHATEAEGDLDRLVTQLLEAVRKDLDTDWAWDSQQGIPPQ